MSRAVIQNFYPNNNVITDTDLNNQYGAVTSATTTVNQDNVRFEGIDTRQISSNPVLVIGKQFTNNYKLTLPATPAAGALYMAKSDPNWNATYGANVSEIPINHDSTGTKTTIIGNGTKQLINGGNGVVLQDGDVVRIDMDIVAWTIEEVISGVRDNPLGGMGAAERSKLINGVGGQVRGFGGNFGSGMGEWCSLIYPKANITSAIGNDVDFVPLGTAFGVTGMPEFGNLIGVAGNVNPPTTSFYDMQDDFDQTLVLPIHHMSPTNDTVRPAFMPYYEGHRNSVYANYNYDQPPLRESTSIFFQVKGGNKTLYSLQLYYSGIWRMAANGTAPVLYLERQDCDPALGGQHFGVSTGVYLEECRWGIQIFRNVT